VSGTTLLSVTDIVAAIAFGEGKPGTGVPVPAVGGRSKHPRLVPSQTFGRPPT